MDEQKYYTPTVDQLFVGYECLMLRKKGDWQPAVLGISPSHFDTIYQRLFHSSKVGRFNIQEHIRTPFLTREQIEAEGFTCFNDHGIMTEGMAASICSSFGIPKHLDSYESSWNMIVYHDLHMVSIIKDNDTVFVGECKSINELRKIMQWVGIKMGEK